MNLTYRLEGIGYVIMNNEVDWIVQDVFFPYKRETPEESAQAHIEVILMGNEEAQQEQTSVKELKGIIASQQEQIDALVLAQLMQGGNL